MEDDKKKGLEGWAILELMGHRRLAGKVSEAVIAGAPLLRIDVPLPPPAEGFSTQFYGSPAIYCLTPTTEELARAVARADQPAPVNIWELPELRRKALPAPRPAPMYECEEGCGVTADSPEEAQTHADATGHLPVRVRGEGPLISPRQALDGSVTPMAPAAVTSAPRPGSDIHF
jgi:hypothetical protein